VFADAQLIEVRSCEPLIPEYCEASFGFESSIPTSMPVALTTFHAMVAYTEVTPPRGAHALGLVVRLSDAKAGWGTGLLVVGGGGGAVVGLVVTVTGGVLEPDVVVGALPDRLDVAPPDPSEVGDSDDVDGVLALLCPLPAPEPETTDEQAVTPASTTATTPAVARARRFIEGSLRIA
jgi:hypothetical protein